MRTSKTCVAPVFKQNDALIRDSYNAPLTGPAEPWNTAPVQCSAASEVGKTKSTDVSWPPPVSSSTKEAAEVSSSPQPDFPERVVRYRSTTPPAAQPPKLVSAASQCSPPSNRREETKRKKSKKQKRCKSSTPDSRSGKSRSKARPSTWPKHRSRSPPEI